MSQRESNYLLELEAADYFKLNVSQVRDLSPHLEGLHHHHHHHHHHQKTAPKCARASLSVEKGPIRKAITRTKSTDTSGLSRKTHGHTQTVGCYRPKGGHTGTLSNMKTVQTQTIDVTLSRPMYPSVHSPCISLQSLPSISSSASVSPSLVCPHLTLDDIINRQHTLESPHTIGLCKKCRLEPPPNVQSPLSPVFKAHSVSQPAGLNGNLAVSQPSCEKVCGMIKRRHSDQQVAAARRRRLSERAGCAGDESLDYWLEPQHSSGLELSASLRNSVEFIRSHPTESARILRIYKNGQPYEKPLRVSMVRGEFTSLAHLLEHINSRFVIPYGARYLFHLGGQLVYSENELKHNSVYVVSGTRNFNFRANAIIEEAQRKRRLVGGAPPAAATPAAREEPVQVRRDQRGAQREQKARREENVKKVPDTAANHVAPNPSRLEHFEAPTAPAACSPQPVVSGRGPKDKPKQAAKPLETCPPHTDPGTKKLISPRRKTRPTKVKQPGEPVAVQTAQRLRKVTPTTTSHRKETPNRSRVSKVDTLSKSSENLKGVPKQESTPVMSKSIVRAKSELSDATGRRKKNVTFMDSEALKARPVKKVSAPVTKLQKPKIKAKEQVLPKLKPELKGEPKEEELGDLPENEKEATTSAEKGPTEEATPEPDTPVKKSDPRGERVNGEWQYPGGGAEANSTPEERPISQMEADETTSKSKVVTPSPSLSLTGDSLKLSISLDEQKEQQQEAARQVRPVLGKPCPGTNLPANNFKLLWVNGININERASGSPGFNETNTGQQQALLSAQPAPQPTGSSQFKIKDTFHNWLCYSSRYDELVYPSGCLVVLWWISRDEQRYYSGHTLNVTAVALCSHDKELGASAQVGGTCVHLWTLAKLETVRVVDDSQFVDLHLFSLSLRNSPEDGCELVVGGYANKRIKVVTFFLDLSSGTAARLADARGGENARPTRRRRDSLTKAAESTLNASKPLKTNQLPLGLMLASSVRGRLPAGHSEPLDDVIVSIGQQHFQAWFMDRKQRSLKPIESKPLGSVKVKDITDTLSCYARLGPGEILVGTSQGAIKLVRVKCSETRKSGVLAAVGSSPSSSGPHTCKLELIPLCQLDNCAITTLTRVSRNTFVSCDAGPDVRLWRIEQSTETTAVSEKGSIVCQPLDSLKIPNDLGFICSIVPTNRLKREPVLELILVSSRNVFISTSMLINEPNSGTLTVIYDGHESPVTGLVSDRLSLSSTAVQADYFTCSLDCNICRWNGKVLVWKSILPSACACLAIHPTGFVLAVGSTDGTVYILDKISGLLISYFPLTPVCINSLAYSRDGALLAAGCANGSIFILPVYERGLKYKKVSIFQSPHPVVSLQFSLDNKYILTSVSQGAYQELVLWDLPNFRYMCQNVRGTVDKIQWFDSICSGSEDVRAIWENKNLTVGASGGGQPPSKPTHSSETIKPVINLSCHRLVRQLQGSSQQQQQQPPEQPSSTSSPKPQNLVIACDTMGYVRLFQYPCYDNRQGFYQARVGSSPANCCRFLPPKNRSINSEVNFVSTSMVGSIFLWSTC